MIFFFFNLGFQSRKDPCCRSWEQWRRSSSAFEFPLSDDFCHSMQSWKFTGDVLRPWTGITAALCPHVPQDVPEIRKICKNSLKESSQLCKQQDSGTDCPFRLWAGLRQRENLLCKFTLFIAMLVPLLLIVVLGKWVWTSTTIVHRISQKY